jgi:hypothetical protein
MQTVGRTRTDCIMTAHEYLKTNDPNNHVHQDRQSHFHKTSYLLHAFSIPPQVVVLCIFWN